MRLATFHAGPVPYIQHLKPGKARHDMRQRDRASRGVLAGAAVILHEIIRTSGFAPGLSRMPYRYAPRLYETTVNSRARSRCHTVRA